MDNLLWILLILLFFCVLYCYFNDHLIDEFSNYGPEYSTNNPEGAPWDISSPYYYSFWGYDQPYGYSYLQNYWNVYGW